MQVVQAVSGTFHHFDLARELESRGHLKTIYSTFPWMRLQREGVPRERVRTFPWIHGPWMVSRRYFNTPQGFAKQVDLANVRLFDAWVAAQIRECDAFVGLSGSGLTTGRVVQARGGKYICDRGCAHIRYQKAILDEEHARWGLRGETVDPRIVEREEAEYAQADAITIPSEFARRTFLEMGVDSKKLRKIPYGVRLERFSKIGEPPSGSFDVLFAGTVSLQKGIPYLLDAFAKLKHPSKRLRLAGPIAPKMRSLLSRFNLTGVELLGRMPQLDLAQRMSVSHVMVLPSVQDGFGMVMAQAMACGTPVIASEHTGGADLFTDGVDGFLVPIRSPEAICDRLTQLADDSLLRQRIGQAALDRVESLGGWRQYGDQYTAFLKQLVC